MTLRFVWYLEFEELKAGLNELEKTGRRFLAARWKWP